MTVSSTRCLAAICRHIGKTYWDGLSADEVQAMIELMPTE